MPVTGLQVGAVRGRNVVLAKGLEIDLAHALAKRLGVPRVRFVHEPLFSTLVSGRPADWDLALAAITITPERARRVDFSRPYLTADQAVLMRQGLTPVPTSIAGLRGLQLCSERATTGAACDRQPDQADEEAAAGREPVTADLRPLQRPLRRDRLRRPCPRRGACGGARALRAVRRSDRHQRALRHRLPEGQPPARERRRGAGGADSRRHAGAAAEALADRRRREAPRAPLVASFPTG